MHYTLRMPIRTRRRSAAATAGFVAALAGLIAAGQLPTGFNYDEAKVPTYTLPDALRLADGRPVADAATWKTARRPELIALYEQHVYGRSAPTPRGVRYVVRDNAPGALGGLATRKQIGILLTGREDGPRIELLMYLPAKRVGRVPAFMGLNFSGNDTVNADPAILTARRTTPPAAGSTAPARGSSASSWPAELILSRGFALVTAFYGDIEPDRVDGRKDGVRATFAIDGTVLAPGTAPHVPEEWGAIGAWAWGLSRALDYLATDPDIDAARVAVLGHSRLGKAAVWAGARDERFALVISAQSGEGGVAITRRQFGETIARINDRFPHWFCDRFKTYNGREDALPVDAHELVALVAPRPVYISSATEDLWSDPRGEFLAARNAEPIYRLLGAGGLGVTEMPSPDQAVGQTIGYHIRTGKHAVTSADWEHYLAFASRHLAH
jgi:hypothetical protein